MAISTGKVVALIQAMGGGADPAVIEAKVEEWLDAHPEATTTVQDGSITEQKLATSIAQKLGLISSLSDEIDNFPSAKYNVLTNTDNSYMDSTGEIKTQEGWTVTDFLRIGRTATYYIKNRVSSTTVKSCFFDVNKEFISAFATDVAGTSTLSNPGNAYYVRFTIQTADVNDFTYTSVLFLSNTDNAVIPTNLYRPHVISTITDNVITGSFYANDGTITNNAAAWARTPLYPITPGDIVAVEHVYGTYAVCFNTNKEFLSYHFISGASQDQNASMVVPENAAYIAFNILNANLNTYTCTVNGVQFQTKYSYDWLAPQTNKSIWNGKTYDSFGDSITWQDGKTWGSGADAGHIAKGYQSIFSEAVGLKSYVNHGMNGWPMAVVENVGGVVQTITGLSDYTDFDLCTIACGTNDFKLNVPLGTLGTIGDTTFDESTFYGAYRKSIEHILTIAPTIRLVLMTPLQRNNSGYDVNTTNTAGHKLIDYVNAIKAIGNMYGIPVCDMYNNSGFTQLTLSTYTLDGLHPNTEGYIRMGNYLTGFLNAVGN